jgi:hypothetical protein
MTVAILVWIPKRTKTAGASSTTSPTISDQAIPVVRKVTKKNTEFVNWGRNPFYFTPREDTNDISNLKLSCIMWYVEDVQALINQSLVRPGDKIADKTVKKIEMDRVILTDGTKDYVLKLQER